MKLELSPVVRYWETNSKESLAILQSLRERGASSVASWVPWAQLEVDRHHLLQKFVKQALACGLKVKLGVTPELGSGYPNAGIPADLLKDRQHLAQDRLGQPIYACAPPNIHALPSLMAPALYQRYGHFLLKFTQEISELFVEGFAGKIELVVSDSLFKNYHNLGLAAGDHGDYSPHSPHSGQNSVVAERIFRARAVDFLRSRFGRHKNVKIHSTAIFARDASLGRLVEELAGAKPNVKELFQQLMAMRSSANICWLDDLSKLSDRERNFLVSSSLVSYGELWVCEEDYRDFSSAFLRKMQRLMEGFSSNETVFVQPAIAFAKNRFAPASITQILQSKLGPSLKIRNSLSDVPFLELEETKLLAVEEGFPLEHQVFFDLVDCAKERDCTVVVFRSSLSDFTQAELAKMESFRLSHGWIYNVTMFDSGGHLLVIEGQEHSTLSMDTLGDSLLGVAKLKPLCTFRQESGNVLSLSVAWKSLEENEEMRTLFLINSSTSPEKLELQFNQSVEVHGLSGGAEGKNEAVGKNLDTTLPPLSVVPLTVLLRKAEEKTTREEAMSHAGTAAELA